VTDTDGPALLERLTSRPVVAAATLAGALAAFACSGRTWRVGNGAADPITGLASRAAVAGTGVAPAVRACALAALAGTLVLLLVRSATARSIVAALIALVMATACGIALDVCIASPPHLDATAWPWLGAASSLIATLGGLAGVAGARRWQSRSSDRYDSPSAPVRSSDEDAWQALDRGEDPTL
jgi:Tryptophan-associated transmembrane protein (Trp_oprn_chp)